MAKKMVLSLYQCALCTLKFPFDKIKYSKDGKKIICIDCYNKIQKKEQKAAEALQKTGIRSATNQSNAVGIQVMCTNCNYKFSYRPNLKPMCPYCGGKKLRKYEELTAEKLIKESSRDY